MTVLTFTPYNIIKDQIIADLTKKRSPEFWNNIFENINIDISIDIKCSGTNKIDGFLSDFSRKNGNSEVTIYYLSNYYFSQLHYNELIFQFESIILYNLGKHLVYDFLKSREIERLSPYGECKFGIDLINALALIHSHVVYNDYDHSTNNKFNHVKALHQLMKKLNSMEYPTTIGFHKLSLEQFITLLNELTAQGNKLLKREDISNTKIFQEYFRNQGGFNEYVHLKPFLNADLITEFSYMDPATDINLI